MLADHRHYICISVHVQMLVIDETISDPQSGFRHVSHHKRLPVHINLQVESLSTLLALEVDTSEDKQAHVFHFTFATLTSEVHYHMFVLVMARRQRDYPETSITKMGSKNIIIKVIDLLILCVQVNRDVIVVLHRFALHRLVFNELGCLVRLMCLV